MFRKLFLSLALFVFTLTACELQEPVPQTPPVPAAAKGDDECTPEIRSVPMTFIRQTSGIYSIKIETGPFYVRPCMCRLTSYELSVSPGTFNLWTLNLVQGNIPVPFIGSTLTTEDILKVVDVGPIFQQLGSPGNGELLAKPDTASRLLNRASGLCVIDNYDGIGGDPIGALVSSPVIQVVGGPLPGMFTVKVYVPNEMTNPI